MAKRKSAKKTKKKIARRKIAKKRRGTGMMKGRGTGSTGPKKGKPR